MTEKGRYVIEHAQDAGKIVFHKGQEIIQSKISTDCIAGISLILPIIMQRSPYTVTNVSLW